jgi:alkaline phosphatase D
MRLIQLVIVLCLGSSTAWANETVISRIGFGSCARQDRPQPIWTAVNASKPDIFLLIGDNIYGDTQDMAVMRAKYEQFSAVPGFVELRKNVPILGTWDDHDYGRNDAGAEYPMKRQSQQVFLDFFGVPKDSPRRAQEGVYHSEIFGPAGKRVQVILLDTRYFRSPLKTADGSGKKPYIANTDPGATVLGDIQWRWLEQQLRKPAELRLIVSSIQVVSEDHGSEKWMNFPAERERLYALLRTTSASGVLFLSGDRHFADLSMMDGGIGYPIHDLTSSGLNQSSKTWRPLQSNPHRIAGMSYDDNFGLITVDWSETAPLISLQIRDVEGDIRINHKLPLSVLQIGTLKTSKSN